MISKKRNYLIGKGFINSLLAALLASMITNLSSVVDGIITGNYLGAAALSAIGLSTPVLLVLDCFYDVVFDGAVSKASIDLGSGDRNILNARLSASFFLGYIISAITSLVLFFTLSEISRWMIPEDETVRIYFVNYAGILILFRLISNLFLPFTRYFRALGHPTATTVSLLIANVGNLIFDLIFVRLLNWGVAGSAWATVCGWLVSIPFVVFYYKKIHIMRLGNPFPWIRVFLKENIKCALPGVVGTILMSALGFTINSVAQKMAGTEGITIVTIGMQLLSLSGVMVFGLRKTMILLGGIFYGEKDYEGVFLTYKRVLRGTIISIGLVSLLMLAFPGKIIDLYGCRNPDIINFQENILRSFPLFMMPLYLAFALSSLYQILRCYKLSFFGSTGPLIFLIILLEISNYILPDLFWWSFGCAGWTAFFILMIMVYKKSKQEENCYFPSLIPKENDFESYILVLPYSMEGFESTIESVRDFCKNNGVSKHKTDLVVLFCEEVAQNIIMYAKKKNHGYFEIRICITNTINITCKDDGIPFNPILDDKEKMDMLIEKNFNNLGRGIISASMYHTSYDYICGQNVTRCSL